VCCVWLLAMAACGSPVVTDTETDTVIPIRPEPILDSGPGMPPALSPVLDEDAGSEQPDAAPDLPAADGGSDSQVTVEPEPADPVMEPLPAPPPEPPPLTVRFEPPGGGFQAPFMLSLHGADPAAEVHYTLDGTIPSRSSPLATAAIRVESTTLVRAVAVRDGRFGPITHHAYFQVAADALPFRSNLPVVVIDVQNGALPDALTEDHVSALLGVFEPEDGSTALERSASVTNRIGIKVRGRSTRYQDKHSYTLELRGVNDEDAPVPLLGMPAEGDWVLYAPYIYDRSLVHNALGYELSRRIGRYAPRTQFCEVFLVSGALGVTQASYRGIYVLTERITRGDERVNVRKLADEDLSGGYIVQANEPDLGDQPFMAAGRQFLHVYPKQEDILPQQIQYISQYIDAAARAASAADGVDVMTGQHYAALLDVNAFVDHHILNVLVKNPDAFALSSYFHKDRGGPLVAGPMWDLDLALGANDPWGQRSLDPTRWNPGTDSIFERGFWGPLFTHAEFEQAYWARWNELLAGPFRITELHAIVNAFEQQLTEAELRNRARWPESAPRNDSFAAEMQALRDWLAARVAWISANLGVIPPG